MNPQILELTKSINLEIDKLNFGKVPSELYDPIYYILNLGGKRLRPLLVLLSYELFKDDASTIMPAALAVEIFHNFTLMHDDIMDSAPLRRGKSTVHEKWNENIAILSGDVMLVKAYELLYTVPDNYVKQALMKFNDCATQVCEGQQKDMNFENLSRVMEEEYLEMIRQKTGILLGFCSEFGGLLAEKGQETQHLLKEFGIYLGIGFQLKDDLLDVYADKDTFGKQVGGDIIANKKTYLLIKAMEQANNYQLSELEAWLHKIDFDKSEKISAIKNIYDDLNIKSITENKISEYFQLGFNAVNKLNTPKHRKDKLTTFTEDLINRVK